MWPFIAGALSAAWDIFGGAAEVVTEAATGLGDVALTKVGEIAWPVWTTGVGVGTDVLTFAGETVGGGLDILGGLPKATAKTLDYLGNLSPKAVQGLQTYRTLTTQPITQAVQPRGVQVPGFAPTPAEAPLPVLPAVAPAYGVTLPEWGRTAQAQIAAQPDYLIYIAIAAIAILVLRK